MNLGAYCIKPQQTAGELLRSLVAVIMAALVMTGALAETARAQDNALYTVTGIKVDAKEKDAAQAKLKAISQAQVKAFRELVDRIGGPEALEVLSKLGAREIGRMMASLSIEEERTGPRRYIGKLTIRFLPDKVKAAFAEAGLTVTEEQSPKIVILPVWRGPDGDVIWQDNPWRKAWGDLKAENGLVPVIVPLGDLNDQQAITAAEALEGHQTKLDSIRFRYDAAAILVAVATPESKNSLHASMSGASPLGNIGFDKKYTGKQGQTLDDIAAHAASRFYRAMLFKWKRDKGSDTMPNGAGEPQSFTISVPFSSPDEWNNLRIELLTTPGVTGVDVTSISSNGAVVQLTYVVPFPALQHSLKLARLNLTLVAGQWVLQRY